MLRNMTHTTALEASRAHFDAAQASAQALREEYDQGPNPGQSARVAAHHNAIRFGLKAAEVNALISLAESARALAGALIDAETVEVLEGELTEVEALVEATTPRDRVRAAQPSTAELTRRIRAAR